MTIPAPFDQFRHKVQSDWIDYNQHMNMGYYMVVFDFATDAWLDYLGMDAKHREANQVTTFTLEGHITYDREVMRDDPLRFTTRLLDFDEKRIHYFHEMYHAEQGYLAATNELMTLHVSLQTRRAAPMADSVLERLTMIKKAHVQLPIPTQVGRLIGLKSKPAKTGT